MKKSLVILTSLIMLCIMLVGCMETNATISTSNELNKNLTILSNTVKRLDTVDNDYLINDDLYAMEEIEAQTKNINTTNINKTNATPDAQNTQNLSTSNANETLLKEQLQDALKNEIISRLYCDENGNCKLCKTTFECDENGVCNNCHQTIICDENGNCSTCKSELNLNENNECNNCKNTCVSDTQTPCTSISTLNGLKQISKTNTSLNNLKFKNTELGKNNAILNTENFEKQNDIIDIKSNGANIFEEDIVSNDTLVDNFHNEKASSNNTLSFETNSNIANINEMPNEKTGIQIYQLKDENLHTKTSTSPTNTTSEGSENSDENLNENFNNNSNKTTDDSTVPSTSNPDDKNYIKIVYLYTDNITPNYTLYTPRFTTNFDYNTLPSKLENYVNKIHRLYTMTEDVVNANNNLRGKKESVLNTIEETRKLNDCISTGECTPTDNQVDALNNYLIDIKATIKNIRNCNGELTNEINKISNSSNGLSQSIDVISSNYLKILNKLDTRISYHENAIATLEQIKAILEESYNNLTAPKDDVDSDIVVTPPVIDDGIDIGDTSTSDTVTPDVDTPLDNNVSEENSNNNIDSNNTQIDESNQNEKNDLGNDSNVNSTTPNNDLTTPENNTNSIDDEIESDAKNTTTDIDDNDANKNLENTSTVDKRSDLDNGTDTENNNAEQSTSTPNDDIKLIPDDEMPTDLTDDISDDSTFDSSIVDNNVIADEVSSENILPSNIDTYMDNTFSQTNIDTLSNSKKKNKQNIILEDNVDTKNQSINDGLNSNETTPNPIQTNENITSNNETLFNGNNSTNGDIIYNGTNGGITNNGLYSNSIINENNIGETDLENLSYRYDKNGHLYNNTNGFNSSEINNQNINNNNVNTYKYNTMVDTINRGTVNNGINTL